MTRPLRLLVAAACGAAVTLPLAAYGASVVGSHTAMTTHRPAMSVPPLIDASSSPWTTWSLSVYSPDFLGDYDAYASPGFVYLPMAIDAWPSLTKYLPLLATSWSVSGNTFTVDLVPNVTWQNGQPLTGTDVVDTLLLDGADGAAVWNDITDVTSPSTHVVQLTLKTGVPLTTFESDFFSGVIPYPSSVYGQFMTSSLKADDLAYWKLNSTNPAAAAKSPAYKALTAVLSKLEAFNPKTLVGDGPYILTSSSSAAREFVKWDGFYDAGKITVPEIIGEATSQSETNGELLAGHATFSSGWLYMTPAILDQWVKTPNANLVAVTGTAQGYIIFNDNRYPYTITKVRQALAYALPVSEMDLFAWGGFDGHAAAPVQPDGLVSRIAAEYLTPSQIASLNKYSYNTSEAAKLLDEAGFHRNSSGDWMMPNGKPFTITLTIESAASDQIAALGVAASALTSFGIPSTEDEIESTTYANDWHDGDFEVTTYCCYGGEPNPLSDFVQSPMGSAENFTSPSERGIAFGPVETVPGIGKVNIPDARKPGVRDDRAWPEDGRAHLRLGELR